MPSDSLINSYGSRGKLFSCASLYHRLPRLNYVDMIFMTDTTCSQLGERQFYDVQWKLLMHVRPLYVLFVLFLYCIMCCMN